MNLLSNPNAIEILPKLVWHYNEPFADSSAIPTYYVANMTKDFVKVVLTGDAGDENFAGYPRYLRSKWVASFTKIPDKTKKRSPANFLRSVFDLPLERKDLESSGRFYGVFVCQIRQGIMQSRSRSLMKKRRKIFTRRDFRRTVERNDPLDFLLKKFEESDTEDPLEQLLYVDINSYLPEDLLVKMDIATMANSLEARVPFLDHKFMELVAGIPSQLKLKGSMTKFILKKAFSDLLPEAILKRKKMGFGVPISRWFRNELKDYVYEILLDTRTMSRGYFREKGIKRLLDEHIALRYDHSAKIWALLILEIWFRIFMDREGDFMSYDV